MTNPYKCRVEYLESTGTQYIDTNILAQPKTCATIDFQLTTLKTTSLHLFEAYPSTTGSYFYAIVKNGKSGTKAIKSDEYSFGLGNYGKSKKIAPDLNRHTLKLDESTLVYEVSDVFSEEFSYHLSDDVQYYPIRIFEEGLEAKLYGFKIERDGVSVCDMIPVIDNSDTPAIYDQVSGRLFYNQGTGQFKVGPYKADNLNKKLLRKKLALMLANLKKKRKYYCELEYIEGTGTQYIDTGYVATENTRVLAKLYTDVASNRNWFGGFVNGSGSSAYGFCFNAMNRSNIEYVFGDSGWRSISAQGQQVVGADFTVDFSKDGVIINDTLIEIPSYTTFTAQTANLFLFVRPNGTGRISGKMYYCKIWDDGVLVRDFIPVLDWNYVPCMYDRVTDQLFYNAGTGDFIAGREIHPVEYIEATNAGVSTQYAVGNYRLTDTTDWEITFSAENPNNNWVLGQPTWIGVHYRKDTTTGNLPRVGITNGSAAVNQCYVDYTDNEKITLALKGTDVYANGVKVGTITRVSAPATQTKFGIFAYKDINQALPNLRIQSAKIYEIKIWDNGVLVQDLIPAIDENGVGGFFENVSRTFIDKESNSNSEFQYPAREVEYLQSTGTQYVDTGIPLSNENTVKAKIRIILENNSFFYGARKSYSVDAFGLHRNFAPFGSDAGYNYVNLSAGTDYIVEQSQNGIFINGELKKTYPVSTFTTPENCYLFYLRQESGFYDSPASARIYYFQVYNNTLVRDFIPVFKDGQRGMLDKLTGTLYTNQASGDDFSVGKIVESEYE